MATVIMPAAGLLFCMELSNPWNAFALKSCSHKIRWRGTIPNVTHAVCCSCDLAWPSLIILFFYSKETKKHGFLIWFFPPCFKYLIILKIILSLLDSFFKGGGGGNIFDMKRGINKLLVETALFQKHFILDFLSVTLLSSLDCLLLLLSKSSIKKTTTFILFYFLPFVCLASRLWADA